MYVCMYVCMYVRMHAYATSFRFGELYTIFTKFNTRNTNKNVVINIPFGFSAVTTFSELKT